MARVAGPARKAAARRHRRQECRLSSVAERRPTAKCMTRSKESMADPCFWNCRRRSSYPAPVDRNLTTNKPTPPVRNLISRSAPRNADWQPRASFKSGVQDRRRDGSEKLVTDNPDRRIVDGDRGRACVRAGYIELVTIDNSDIPERRRPDALHLDPLTNKRTRHLHQLCGNGCLLATLLIWIISGRRTGERNSSHDHRRSCFDDC